MQGAQHVLSGFAQKAPFVGVFKQGDGWFAARVLPQLHVLVWGNKRGV